MSFNSAMTGAFAIFFAIALFFVWLLALPDAMEARFAKGDCRVIEVIDARTGRPVIGAEDLALAPDGDRLIFSAYDRRNPARPDGGLYAISLWELAGARRIRAERLDIEHFPRAGAFRPHGIALSPDGSRLALINRPEPGRAGVEIGALGRDWTPQRLIEERPLCRANDLMFNGAEGDELLVTLDRTDCFASLRDLSPWATSGRIARTDGKSLVIERTGLAFANGLAPGLVAETRRNRLTRADGSSIALPGGPDNMTVTKDGAVIVAVHPKLAHLWLALRGWRNRAPSRIVNVDPESGVYEVLFDDPEGIVFPAATAAVLNDDRLLAGSVIGSGLLLCEHGG